MDHRTIVGNANRLMIAAGRPPTLSCFEEVATALSTASLCVQSVQNGLGCNIPRLRRSHSEETDLGAVINYLQEEVLQIDLSHISPKKVLRGCVLDIANLTEIIAALVCLEWKPDVPVDSPPSSMLDRQTNDTTGLHGLFGQTSAGHIGDGRKQLPHNSQQSEWPTSSNSASSQCLAMPSHPKLSARDCTNLPVQNHSNLYTKVDSLSPSSCQINMRIDEHVIEASRAGAVEWCADRDGCAPAAPVAAVSSVHSTCSMQSTGHAGTSGQHVVLWGAVCPDSPSVRGHGCSTNATAPRHPLSELPGASSMHTSEAHVLHNRPAHACSSSADNRLVQAMTAHDVRQLGIDRSSVSQDENCCGRTSESSKSSVKFGRDRDIRQAHNGGKKAGEGSQSGLGIQSNGWNVKRHGHTASSVSDFDTITQESAWKEKTVVGASRLATRKVEQHSVDPQSTLSQHLTMGSSSASAPQHALSGGPYDAYHMSTISRNARDMSGLKHKQTIRVRDEPHGAKESRMPAASCNPADAGGRNSAIAAGNQENDLDRPTEEDDAVLAAVIQNILQDEPVDFLHPSLPFGGESPASAVNAAVQSGSNCEQENCRFAMDESHVVHTNLRSQSPSDVVPESIDKLALPENSADGMRQRCIREQPTSSSVHSDEEGSAASVEDCTHPKVLQTQAQNRRQETSDVLHSSPGTTDPSTVAKPPKVGRQCRRKKGHSSLCGTLKSAPDSSKPGQNHFKEKELPCSNPWLPNGKSGVGLVSTAVSPIRKQNDGAKQEKRTKRRQGKVKSGSDAVPNTYLTDMNPIGGVRACGRPSNPLPGRAAEACRSHASHKVRPVKGRLEATLACKLAHVMKLKQASPGTQSRQARATALTEEHSVSRSKAQIRLVEKLARAQKNRAIVAESRRASRQERAKRLAQAVHIHKATMDLSEAVHVLETTTEEQTIAKQRLFRDAFLQAVEAEKKAVLDMHRGSRQIGLGAATAKPKLKGRPCSTGKGSDVVCMQARISRLQDELRPRRHDQSQREQLHASMDHLSLQLQKLYTDAKMASDVQENQEYLLENIRKLVQDTIFAV